VLEVKSIDRLLETSVSNAYAVKAGPWIFLTGHEAYDWETGIPDEVAGPPGFPLYGSSRSRREGDFILQRARDLALFNLAIDSKLRGCDLVRIRCGGRRRPRSTRRRATCEPSNCSSGTRNWKARSAILASRSRSAFPSRSSCKLKRRGRGPCDKRGPDAARATDSCAFTSGRYRRRNAPFDIMAINRDVGS
jgi:hypothetical protein